MIYRSTNKFLKHVGLFYKDLLSKIVFWLQLGYKSSQGNLIKASKCLHFYCSSAGAQKSSADIEQPLRYSPNMTRLAVYLQKANLQNRMMVSFSPVGMTQFLG